MRSHGTKDTQGVNGDAAALSRWLGASLNFAGVPACCPYSRHRPTDWTLGPGHVQCGICHPPAIRAVLIDTGELWSDVAAADALTRAIERTLAP